jgi:hypothetical protein
VDLYIWLMSITEKYEEAFHVMGIDLSKAFDCVDREILLSIINGKVSENTYRIIKFLIS